MRLFYIGRTLGKAQNTTLTLSSTTRHLLPRLHCGLATCIQHSALATYRSLKQGYSL
jgi:hypothetical protein